MNYIFENQGLKIKFSIKERIILFFKGYLKLNDYSSYVHSAHLLKLVSDATTKYGDGKKHGNIG